MIFFDACAVRAIITAVALCLGISAPPALISQTRQLLFNDCPATDLHSELQVLSVDGSGFTLSMEWALFNPKHGLCLTAEHKLDKQLTTIEDSVADSVLDHPTLFVSKESLICSNSSLDFNDSIHSEPLSTIDYSAVTTLNFTTYFPTIVTASSVTAPFELYSFWELDTPLSVLEPESESSSGLLSHLEHLRLTLRKLILTSIPVQWAEWTTQNRLTVGLMCVSVMYGCILCPLLYYLWTQAQSNKRLVLKLKTVDGRKLMVESRLSVLTRENDTLIEKLSGANSHSLILQDKIGCYSTRLRNTEESNAQLKNKLTRVSNDFETELLDTRKELECYKLLKFEAKERLVLVQEQMQRQKKESLETKEQLHLAINSLYNQLQQNKQEHKQALAKLTRVNSDLEAKLLDTQRQLEKCQLMEFNAQEKLVEVREQLERQKAESKENKELFCSALSSFIKRLREDKKNCDKVLANIRATEDNLSLGHEELKHKISHSESVSDAHTGVKADDSGICELDTSLLEEDSDSSLLVSMMDH